ncbi:MAG TPA: hypothetical protein VML75_06925, partial [Kofleriaceae bacterium]|nr:hypothetical protein [Kofleriaceae bacterium]
MHRLLIVAALAVALLALPGRAVAQVPDGDPGDANEPSPPAADPAPVPSTAVPTVVPDEPEADAKKEISGESGFMDVRLNLTLTNENVFAEPGETIPSVPGWRFGRPNSLGTLFFDNYDTRFSGYETLSHAVLYRQVNRENWEVEGALVLRINDVAENKIDLSDAGSYVRVAYWRDPERKDPTRLSVVAFPTSSDRLRLGYSYRLSWGGSPEYRRTRTSVPGIKVQVDTGKAYAFVGAKSAVVLDRATGEEEAVLGFMTGAGVDVTEMVRAEVNGGYFDRGANELQDVLTERVQLFGASAQVAIHHGMPVGSSIDYALYRNDPERVGRLFRQEEYPGGTSWLVKAEATLLGQTLKDPERTGSTKVQWGTAGDVNARIKIDRTRIRFDTQVRDLAFILHSTPSLPTFSDFPMAYDQTPNFFAAIGADQNFEDQLTLGIVLGADLPSTLTTPTGMIPGDTVPGSGTSTAVIRGENDITILPENESAQLQLAAKLTARLDFAEYFASILDV